MSSPSQPARDSNAGEGTAFSEESGLADKNLDAFRASATGQDPTYIVSTGSVPQQPDQTPSRFTYPFLRGPGGALADD